MGTDGDPTRKGNDMRLGKIMATMTALAAAGMLAACGAAASSLAMDSLDEADGVKVVAENAGEDKVATLGGAIEIGDGDVLVISPFLDKGALHLTVTSGDGKVTAYDDDADGKVMFSVDAEPGTYDVQVTGVDGATGWMTVFAQDADELAAQDASLGEALEEAGVDAQD